MNKLTLIQKLSKNNAAIGSITYAMDKDKVIKVNITNHQGNT